MSPECGERNNTFRQVRPQNRYFLAPSLRKPLKGVLTKNRGSKPRKGKWWDPTEAGDPTEVRMGTGHWRREVPG
jgi:hypothetical protein